MEHYRIETPKARAAGLGSAKSGFGHWWVERATAVALLPLGIWFAASLIAHVGSDYETFIHWLSMPINAVFMVMLLAVLFWHAALGLQVVIEDYIHSGAKVWLLLVTRFACFALMVTGIMATLRIAFEGWGAA